MMRTRIKICCIADQAEAALAIAAGADALGLVAAMPTGPGCIDDALIAQIAAQIPPPVASVLLTAQTTAQAIAAHVRATHASVVQVVNHIDPDESAALKVALPNVRILQVIHVEDETALDQIPLYSPFVHTFLLDSGKPSQAILGGTGATHDWSISARFVAASPVPVFLAGGLNAQNVRAAIDQVAPFGVDICSGVRTNGALDEAKLADFMAAVAG